MYEYEAFKRTETDTMTEWQPIETVPRDGTPVLALAAEGGSASFNCRQAVCVFGFELYHQDGKPEHAMCFFMHDEWGNPQKDMLITCSHWMPLPELPKGDSQ